MNHATALSAITFALLAAAAGAALAAPPKTLFVDHSKDALIDEASAKAVMAEGISARVLKTYPATKWGFVSQVEGGMTANGTCVVTARVMMMQLTPTMKVMLFRPEKTATAFDALANANAEQCKALAKTKLREAVQSVASSLAKG